MACRFASNPEILSWYPASAISTYNATGNNVPGCRQILLAARRTPSCRSPTFCAKVRGSRHPLRWWQKVSCVLLLSWASLGLVTDVGLAIKRSSRGSETWAVGFIACKYACASNTAQRAAICALIISVAASARGTSSYYHAVVTVILNELLTFWPLLVFTFCQCVLSSIYT